MYPYTVYDVYMIYIYIYNIYIYIYLSILYIYMHRNLLHTMNSLGSWSRTVGPVTPGSGAGGGVTPWCELCQSAVVDVGDVVGFCRKMDGF